MTEKYKNRVRLELRDLISISFLKDIKLVVLSIIKLVVVAGQVSTLSNGKTIHVTS